MFTFSYATDAQMHCLHEGQGLYALKPAKKDNQNNGHPRRNLGAHTKDSEEDKREESWVQTTETDGEKCVSLLSSWTT